MRILHLSDWHTVAESFARTLENETRDLPDPDLVLVTGDMIKNTSAVRRIWADPYDNKARAEEAQFQRQEWLWMVPHLERRFEGVDILAVPGNHDFCDYGVAGRVQSFDAVGDGSCSVVWKGIRIHGFRGTPAHRGHWTHEYSNEAFAAAISYLHPDTQILVTHAPPFGILDDVHDSENAEVNCTLPVDMQIRVEPMNIGSQALRDWVDIHPNLKLHVFGHVHEQGGRIRTVNNTLYSNASGTVNLIEVAI